MRFRIAVTCFLAMLAACVVGSPDEGGAEPEPELVAYCLPKAIDSSGDGVADGLDINCDGKIDISYTGGGGSGGGTQSSSCSTMSSTNGQARAISCTGNGSSATCECRVNHTLVRTCTQQTLSCSIGNPSANCCGF
jgi:hypothetical protein